MASEQTITRLISRAHLRSLQIALKPARVLVGGRR